jgi:hypothetical protein
MTKACWGLTTESGGQLSHGAVVAREYGIAGATQLLHDGQVGGAGWSFGTVTVIRVEP